MPSPSKLLFRFYSSIFDEEMVETVWASAVDAEKGWYKIDNIPFYVPGVAWEDVVFAEYDEQEEMLTYRNTVERSGNSTIQVVMLDKSLDIDEIRVIFEQLGCDSEKANEGYFVLNVPAAVNYLNIKVKLEEFEALKYIDWAAL
jgi:Domain of unknown function (DUF4265)